jgi:RNA polymerase sigma-70 factor (ECF subfamily)
MGSRIHAPAMMTPEACAECVAAHRCEPCFEALMRRYQSPLLHFLTRRLASRHDAEDLVQETFLAAFRNIGEYDSKWCVSTWLFTIATRLAASRRRRQRPGPAAGVHPENEPARRADPADDAERGELRSLLWDAVRQSLDDDSFSAVWLSYVETMSAEQIGQVLGRNANAVRILLYRARARLGLHPALSRWFEEHHYE